MKRVYFFIPRPLLPPLRAAVLFSVLEGVPFVDFEQVLEADIDQPEKKVLWSHLSGVVCTHVD
jgi:hypothetical protein